MNDEQIPILSKSSSTINPVSSTFHLELLQQIVPPSFVPSNQSSSAETTVVENCVLNDNNSDSIAIQSHSFNEMAEMKSNTETSVQASVQNEVAATHYSHITNFYNNYYYNKYYNYSSSNMKPIRLNGRNNNTSNCTHCNDSTSYRTIVFTDLNHNHNNTNYHIDSTNPTSAYTTSSYRTSYPPIANMINTLSNYYNNNCIESDAFKFFKHVSTELSTNTCRTFDEDKYKLSHSDSGPTSRNGDELESLLLDWLTEC